MAAYAQSQGVKLLEAAFTSYGPLFSTDQAVAVGKTLELSRDRVHSLLSQLQRSTWIARLKRGVYAVQSPLFQEDIHPFAIAQAIVKPMAISHWSALAHHGLTTQIPQMVQASTPKKVVTPEMRKGKAYQPRGRSTWKILDFEFEFINVKKEYFFGWKDAWVSSWHRVRVMDVERTLLETIAHPEYFGSIRFGIEALEQNWAHVDLDQLVTYALRYDVGAVVKRLGWALERLGTESEILTRLHNYSVQNYYRLDPQSPRRGQTNTRWQVVENLRLE